MLTSAILNNGHNTIDTVVTAALQKYVPYVHTLRVDISITCNEHDITCYKQIMESRRRLENTKKISQVQGKTQ